MQVLSCCPAQGQPEGPGKADPGRAGHGCSAFTVVLGISAGVLTHIVLSEKVRGEPWLLCTQIGVRPQAWISRPLCCLYDTERIAQPLTCFLIWGQECRPPQACCCLKQATQSLLWRQAHRPHVGGRCPRRWLPLCTSFTAVGMSPARILASDMAPREVGGWQLAVGSWANVSFTV